ncbi:TolC family protein [Alcaligenes sp. CHO6]|uniref:TolC family protein n=1 Tax=unclassified Alcaligenes TaxID=259357 RepID=UPI0030142C17
MTRLTLRQSLAPLTRALQWMIPCLMLSACAVGLDSSIPATPQLDAPTWSGQFANPASQDKNWWTLLQDPQLDALIAQALDHNLDIAQAQARWRASRALIDERQHDRLPAVTAHANYHRSGSQFAAPDGSIDHGVQENWRLGMQTSWEIDVFGRLEQLARSAQARSQASAAQLDLTRQAIAAELARQYVQAQGLQRRLALAEDDVRSWEQTIRLVEAGVSLGRELPENLDNAQASLERANAVVPQLRSELERARLRMQVLSGGKAQALDAPLPSAQAPLAAALPLGDVNALLFNRPDVRAARQEILASSHDVAAATAELYPRLDLAGFIGFFALRGSDLGHAARAFDVSPALQWPALRLGHAKARLRGMRALADESRLHYQQVLLQAQEEIQGALHHLTQHQKSLLGLTRAARHLEQAHARAVTRYEIGAGAYQDVLENQRDLNQTRQELALAETGSYLNVIALYQALGWGVATSPIRE